MKATGVIRSFMKTSRILRKKFIIKPKINSFNVTCLCDLVPRCGVAKVMKLIGSKPAILPPELCWIL